MKLFGIKFYNPWKPHIVVDGFGRYYVRVHTIFGWEYWGDNWFCGQKFYADSSIHLEIAREKLREAEDYLVKEKTRKKLLKVKYKVVHTE